MQGISIRRAETWEADILTGIAFRSEAYWGYDAAYMENFRSVYRVTEEFIRSNSTFVMEEDGSIIGFYGIRTGDEETSLEYFYIEPERIGKGYGRLLWNHMAGNCKEQGMDRIVLVTSPQAKGFYTRMGAVPSGEVESLVAKGRKIPRLVYVWAE